MKRDWAERRWSWPAARGGLDPRQPLIDRATATATACLLPARTVAGARGDSDAHEQHEPLGGGGEAARLLHYCLINHLN